ncbi:MAG: NAD(P)H-dependent oxidoreductase [Coprobacillaceae bacterium]
MNNVLTIIGSVQPHEKSDSTKVLQAFVDAYKEKNESSVETIDVATMKDIRFTRTLMDGKLTDQDYKIVENRKSYLEAFKRADVIVLASPMWNFGLPGEVKEIIDTFAVSGETFKYLDKPNEDGSIVQALTSGKKLVFIQAMGGMNVGPNDISYALVKQLFGFIGVTDMEYLPIQATDIPGMSETDKAIESAKELASKI